METVYCPVIDGQIDGGDCLLMCDVADQLVKSTVLPDDIVWDDQQRAKCIVCQYHDDL